MFVAIEMAILVRDRKDARLVGRLIPGAKKPP